MIIGSVVVASTYARQEALAMEDSMLENMVEVDKRISELKSIDGEFNEMAMGKISFKVNQIKNELLEINNANQGNDERVDKIYEYLTNRYAEAFQKYQNDVKEYQKENGLTTQEKKLVSATFKNNLAFENNESRQNFEKTEKELVLKTVKDAKSKKDYQELVNKIGAKLANDANGGKIEKIHHKLAIKEIMDSKTWGVVIPAIDRVISQTNDEQSKDRLTDIKNNIEKILEKRDKQSKQEQVFVLKNSDKITNIESIQFSTGEIGFGGILEQFNDDELISSLTDSEKIITEFESNVSLESKIKESSTTNVIEPIFEAALIGSLEEIEEISDDDDNGLEKEREKQRKDARDNKSNNKSEQAKKYQNDKGNSDSKGNSKN